MSQKSRRSSNDSVMSQSSQGGKRTRFIVPDPTKTKSSRKNSFPMFRSLASLGKGFPAKMTISHRYVEKVNVSSVAGSPGGYLFSCNGLFKPNQSAAGHQPYYFDQMSAIYNHYRVIKAKITLSVTPQNSGQTSTYFSLTTNDDTTITNNTVFGQIEQPDSRYGMLAAGSTDMVRILRHTYDPYKVFGVKGVSNLATLMASDWLQGTITANPTEAYNWVFLYVSQDGSTTCNVNVLADITYYAIWDELKEVTTS